MNFKNDPYVLQHARESNSMFLKLASCRQTPDSHTMSMGCFELLDGTRHLEGVYVLVEEFFTPQRSFWFLVFEIRRALYVRHHHW
jgi:hypothetical protein